MLYFEFENELKFYNLGACASVQSDQSSMDALWIAKSSTYFQAENSKTELTARVGGGMI